MQSVTRKIARRQKPFSWVISVRRLNTFTIAQLRDIAQQIGAPKAAVKKADIINAITTATQQGYSEGQSSTLAKRSVISIDVGYRNLAWMYGSGNRVHQWERLTLVPSTTQLVSRKQGENECMDDSSIGVEGTRMTDKRIYSPEIFARNVRAFVSKVNATISAEPLDARIGIVVEQQRIRGGNAFGSLNVFMVNMVEGMLWYGLLESAVVQARAIPVIGIPPGHVSKWLYPTPATAPSKEIKLSRIKKATSVSVIEDILDSSNQKNDDTGKEPTMYIPSKLVANYRSEKKKDDMADCLLQGLAWLDWMQNRDELAQRLRQSKKHSLDKDEQQLWFTQPTWRARLKTPEK